MSREKLSDVQDEIYKINKKLNFISGAFLARNMKDSPFSEDEQYGFSLLIDGVIEHIESVGEQVSYIGEIV